MDTAVKIEPLDLRNSGQCREAWLCYQAGFAGPPWNEFWPLDKIAEDIRAALQLPGGYCPVAITEGKVTGLALGYVLTSENLSNELGIQLPYTGEIAYQDEIVVHPDWQGRGIGRSLYSAWIQHVHMLQVKQVIARTLADPPTLVYNWYQRLGYQVIAHYHDPDKRVILALAI